MNNHTPGPWTIDKTGTASYPNMTAIIDCDGDAIAHVCPYWKGAGLENARLISAAPDLLEALKYIVQWKDKAGGWSPEVARDMANWAIKKTRGEE